MIRIRSRSPLKWIYWMVLDILESDNIEICYRYVYFDGHKKKIVVYKKPLSNTKHKRFYLMSACVDIFARRIYISPNARDKPLCLFHECLEIIFAEWTTKYFKPKIWGIKGKQDPDPIRYLESVFWRPLTSAEKQRIAKFLPKD